MIYRKNVLLPWRAFPISCLGWGALYPWRRWPITLSTSVSIKTGFQKPDYHFRYSQMRERIYRALEVKSFNLRSADIHQRIWASVVTIINQFYVNLLGSVRWRKHLLCCFLCVNHPCYLIFSSYTWGGGESVALTSSIVQYVRGRQKDAWRWRTAERERELFWVQDPRWAFLTEWRNPYVGISLASRWLTARFIGSGFVR